jgi:hypothetical protein
MWRASDTHMYLDYGNDHRLVILQKNRLDKRAFAKEVKNQSFTVGVLQVYTKAA